MSFATFWVEDTFTTIPPLPGFTAAPVLDWHELAEINHISYTEVINRRNNGHRPYVARMDGQPVAYGWLATSKISIGELSIDVELPPDDRYLWDFATLPNWQGRGLYPRLLQSILEQEIQNAKRFWIIHAPENLPSGAGMSKAGFRICRPALFHPGWQCRPCPLSRFHPARPYRRKLITGSHHRISPCPMLELRRNGRKTA